MATAPSSTATAPGLAGWFAGQVANVGEFSMQAIAGIGDVALFSLHTLGWIFARRQRREVLGNRAFRWLLAAFMLNAPAAGYVHYR